MNNATYVGRVGGLAVALGVGFAIASTPGTAWADDAANPGATSAPAQNAAPETAGATKPAAKAGKNKRSPGKASSDKQRATNPAPTAADSPATTQMTAKTVTGSTKKAAPRAAKVDPETLEIVKVRHRDRDDDRHGSRRQRPPASQNDTVGGTSSNTLLGTTVRPKTTIK